jgi:hypothetical protein
MDYTNKQILTNATWPEEAQAKSLLQRQRKIEMLQMAALMFEAVNTFGRTPIMGNNRQPKQEKRKRTYVIEGVTYRV